MSGTARLVLSLTVGAVASIWFGLWSLARWYAGATGAFDLGLFAQAVDAMANGQLPYSDIRGLPLLAEHFSPALVLFVVPWLIWPDPRVLLLAQAVILAVTLALIIDEAARRLSILRTIVLSVLGLMSYSVLSAVEFDVHETTLATFFVACSMIGLLRARRGWVMVGGLGLVLTKEDLGVTVLAIALVWLLRNRHARRPALVLAVIGLVGLVVAALTLSVYGAGGAYLQRVGSFGSVGALIVSIPARLVPAAAFAVSSLGVGLRSNLVLVAVPTLAWRALSSTQAYWQLYWHYDVILWPIALAAVLDGLSRTRLTPVRDRLGLNGLVVGSAALSLIMGVARLVGQPGWQELGHPRAEVAYARELARQVPDGEVIAVQDRYAPYLIPRLTVIVLDVNATRPVRWVLVSGGQPRGPGERARSPACARERLLTDAAAHGDQVDRSGDLFLIRFAEPRVPIATC